MRPYWLLLALDLAAGGAAAAGKDWLREPPANIRDAKGSPIPASAYTEIVLSTAGAAFFQHLKEKSWDALDEYDTRVFAGRDFVCPAKTKPYLLRAMYGQAFNGAFELTRVGRAVWVEHGGLGSDVVPQKTALVVCLGFEPQQVYVTVSIAG